MASVVSLSMRHPALGRELSVFLWVTTEGTDGVRYGRYATVTLKDIRERACRIEFWDGCPSIVWLDIMYVASIRKYVGFKELKAR
jgi:hypothetical protein